MIRKAFVITAKPGMTEEYIRRHNPVWPEMERALREHGVRNYSIFHRESTSEFFGYLEVTDEDLFAQLGSLEVCQRWWRHMTAVLVCASEHSEKAIEEILEDIFYLK